jgi:hypothetical protein
VRKLRLGPCGFEDIDHDEVLHLEHRGVERAGRGHICVDAQLAGPVEARLSPIVTRIRVGTGREGAEDRVPGGDADDLDAAVDVQARLAHEARLDE